MRQVVQRAMTHIRTSVNIRNTQERRSAYHAQHAQHLDVGLTTTRQATRTSAFERLWAARDSVLPTLFRSSSHDSHSVPASSSSTMPASGSMMREYYRKSKSESTERKHTQDDLILGLMLHRAGSGAGGWWLCWHTQHCYL